MLLTSKSQDRIVVEAIFGKAIFGNPLNVFLYSAPTNVGAPFKSGR